MSQWWLDAKGDQGPVYKQGGSLSRGFNIPGVYKENVLGKVTLLPRTELWPVSIHKRSTKEEVFQSQRYIHTFIACARLVTSRPYKFQGRIAKRAKRSVRF